MAPGTVAVTAYTLNILFRKDFFRVAAASVTGESAGAFLTSGCSAAAGRVASCP